MKEFTLRKYNFGDFLGVVGDEAHWKLANDRRRFDADGDMPKLAAACGLTKGDTAIDVGAFIGDTAWALAQYTGANVVAFEPFLDAYTAMLYNVRHLPVRAVNEAVGNGEYVRLVDECPGNNFGMRSVSGGLVRGIPMATARRLDDIPEAKNARIKLIKIDCEGSEIAVLNGARELIKKHRPFLYVEMYAAALAKNGFTPSDLSASIETLGYKLEMWGELPRFDWFCTPL